MKKLIIARHVFKNRGTIAIVAQIKPKRRNIPEFVVWTNRKVLRGKASDWAQKIMLKHSVCVVHGESGSAIFRDGMVREECDLSLS